MIGGTRCFGPRATYLAPAVPTPHLSQNPPLTAPPTYTRTQTKTNTCRIAESINIQQIERDVLCMSASKTLAGRVKTVSGGLVNGRGVD